MQKSTEELNALRDIIDVLYDGYCKILEEEELYITVVKKLRELRFCTQREKQYKVYKIMNILASVHKDRLPLPFLQELNYLCDEFRKLMD